MVIHIERATARGKAAKRIKPNDWPFHAKTFNSLRHEHRSSTLEHPKLDHDALESQTCGILEALVDVRQGVRIPICERRHEELAQDLLEDRVTKVQVTVAR